MKSFLIKSTLFFAGMLTMLYVKPLYLLVTGNYKQQVAGAEIYLSIAKSKQKKKVKKILLGDSVAWQLFSNAAHNDTVNSLACNQAISMAGQYFLLNNYLNAGNQPDTVYMLFRPFTFLNNLDQVYTYQNFLKPFNTNEYQPLFTPTVKRQIEKIPYNFLCREPYILTSNWAPDYLPVLDTSYRFLSPVSAEYLEKIKELSTANHFKLIFVPTPVSLKHKPLLAGMDNNEMSQTKLASEMADYFKKIMYLEDSCFKDGAHLKDPKKYTALYQKDYIK